MSKIFELSSTLVQRVILASFILWPFEVPKYTGQLLSSIFQGWKAKMFGGNLYLDLRHFGISKKITKPFLLGLSITNHKTKANIFAQPSSRAFTEYTHCVRPSLAFHIKAVPVHKGGFSTPVKKLLLLLKIWRCQGCIVYRVYRVTWVVFLFCSADIEILSQAKDVSNLCKSFLMESSRLSPSLHFYKVQYFMQMFVPAWGMQLMFLW